MNRFEGKIVFVTGGARGIGEALARSFADKGALVALADLDATATEATAAAIGADRALAVACDVSSRASVADAMARCDARFGGIDILINNAGRHTLTYNREVTALDEAQWAEMIGTNIMGVVNCSTVAAAAMRRRGGGAILNVDSVSGYEVRTAYGVSKLAVRGLTVALAGELASDNIRVNGVAPGLIRTATVEQDLPPERARHFVEALQLIKRDGRVEDLFGVVHLLCSDEGSFITGETVIVGGGFARHV